METKDWQHVEDLFHAALELAGAERERFLAAACKEEVALRTELESLLRAFEKKLTFLEEPVFNAGLKALSAEASLTGRTIGSYRVERLLGKGGMGEVYLAEDLRLGRPVALKFLARRLAADNWARRQLTKEAQAVARLDHPNICAVHGLEETDGYSFIVMQYVEGDVLSELLRPTAVPAAETGQPALNGDAPGRSKGVDSEQVLSLALQLASALAAAHAHSIIHRDIKPQNMIVSANGHLKVLDFGLAKVVQGQAGARVAEGPGQASRQGLIAGTVAYMSPEQLRAERLDYRSDLFSAGVVLYTLLTGRHPFLQKSEAETIAAILHNAPPPLPRSLNGRARAFAPILGKCLAKDKEHRYQSVNELIIDLQNLQQGTAPIHVPRRFNPLVAVASLVVLMAAGWWTYYRLTALPTLAVLPFVNERDEAQVEPLIAGLPEGLANQLAQLGKLRVRAPATFDKKLGRSPEQALEAGRKLGVAAVLAGQAHAENDSVLLHVQLISTANGARLWDKSYDLKQTGALVLQQLLTTVITANLGIRLSGEDERRLSAVRNEAFNEYWRGRYFWHRRTPENINTAIRYFQHAIALDPAFALAYTGLADSYILLPSVAYGQMPTRESVDKARSEARKALMLDDQLSEAHTSLGVIKLRYDLDWAGADAEFKRAIALKPDDPVAHYWYSHLLHIMGQRAEGLAESETARRLDPLSPAMNLNRCRSQYWLRQFDSAARCFSEMLEQDPDDVNARYILGFVYLAQGRPAPALEIFQKLYRNPNNLRLVVAALGHTYGRLGQVKEATQVLECMQGLAQPYLPPLEFAVVQLGLGNREQTFTWLEQAQAERHGSMAYLTVEPLYDSLRGDPRFVALTQRLNLPQL
ncbi:MAG: protein kinase [Acidobacteria bacterium]|nr:protein kinase [Acidobacteriota bacterium]